MQHYMYRYYVDYLFLNVLQVLSSQAFVQHTEACLETFCLQLSCLDFIACFTYILMKTRNLK